MDFLAISMAILLAMAGYSNAAYCVCNIALSNEVLQKNIDYACGHGADCAQISQNGACFNPNTVKDHCNFAVNSYYQKKGQVQGSCDFSGTATVSQTPPSGANSVCYSGNPSTSTPTPPTGTGTPTPGTGTGTGTPTPGTGTGTGTPTPGTGTGTPGTGTGTGTPGTGTGTGTPGTGTGTGTPGTGSGTGTPGTGTGTGTPGTGTGTGTPGTGTGTGTGSGTMPGINVNPSIGLGPTGTNGFDSSEARMKGKSIPSTPAASTPVLAIGHGKGKKRRGPPQTNWKGKMNVKPGLEFAPIPVPKEATCFYCNEKGHWKRSCPKYLQDLKDGKAKPIAAGTKRK